MPREARWILPYDATFLLTINRGTEHGNDHLRYHGFRQAVSTFSRNALTPLQRHAKARRRASTRRHGAQAPEGCLANTRKIRCITFRLGVWQTSLGWSASRKAVAARRRRRRPPIEHRRRIICASLARLRGIWSLSASIRFPKTLFVSFASFFDRWLFPSTSAVDARRFRYRENAHNLTPLAKRGPFTGEQVDDEYNIASNTITTMDYFGINLFRKARLKLPTPGAGATLLPFRNPPARTKGFLNTRWRYLRMSAGSPR